MATILGKAKYGRLETLQYANEHYMWSDKFIIGVSAYYGVLAWIKAKLTRRYSVYYAIDFYSPEIAKNLWDKVFIWMAMKVDSWLCKHCDECWDISERINEGREKFNNTSYWNPIVPLSYPPNYFRFNKCKYTIPVFVGLVPYGNDVMPDNTFYIGGDWGLEPMLDTISKLGVGISVWKEKGNNYYGDPGKTKLYSACGLPVIMSDNTPYAEVIKKTGAGIVIEDYSKETVETAIKIILKHYDFFKGNVKKTWRYIDADEVFKGKGLLGEERVLGW